MTRSFAHLLAGGSIVAMASAAVAQDLPQANDSYFKAAQAELQAQLARQPITGKAKNIILFVGDGMSVPTVTAARIMAGQMRGADGESNDLMLDTFPFTGLAKTYSHDGQVSDSAPTATAMVTGVKLNNGTIGVDQTVKEGDCPAVDGHVVKTLFEMAEERGLATGVVSTARITHATPAAMYAHTPMRDWESDKELGEAAAQGCKDIADQLVNWPYGDGLEVALGGGRAYFLPESVPDPEDAGKTGRRTDNRNLTEEWTGKGNNHVFVYDQAGFDAVDPASDPKVLGLFEMSHMEYEADREKDGAKEPSIADMTAKAIDILQRDGDGFVLMVEGGRIDHAHHAGNAYRALMDAIALDAAISKAIEMTSREETLIVVTADHSHSMTINGYPKRGNPILGLVTEVGDTLALGADGKPYTTISYANGPGGVFPALAEGSTAAEPAGARPDLTGVDTTSVDYVQQALVPMSSETHTGDDVAIYAWGPQAHLLTGTVEQNLIYHVLAHALGFDEAAQN
ncbi:MAG TPA: alkaline phosphatase [Bauldia sp.]|nr:alkaline phosphatase [Bauldia sp.]